MEKLVVKNSWNKLFLKKNNVQTFHHEEGERRKKTFQTTYTEIDCYFSFEVSF